MKLEALFKSQDKKLVRISDEKEFSLENIKIFKANEIETALIDSDFFAVEVPWSTVELEEGCYNEEFLAELRNFLKKAEARNQFGFIIPVVDKDYASENGKVAFIDAYNHTARRIKDCISVMGFSIPDETVDAGQSESFMETLAIKHKQYIYFVKNCIVEKLNDISDFGIVAY